MTNIDRTEPPKEPTVLVCKGSERETAQKVLDESQGPIGYLFQWAADQLWCGRKVCRAAWSDRDHLEVRDGYLIHVDGGYERWNPTLDDALATDWILWEEEATNET